MGPVLTYPEGSVSLNVNLIVGMFDSLLPRHALAAAHPGHLRRPADQRGHGHPLLVPLHPGGFRLARGGPPHGV